MIKKQDVLLNWDEIAELSRCPSSEAWSMRVAKASQLKMMELLKKILYEICPHKEFPQRNKIDCTLCIMECMSELDKILKDGE
jgi:hypothetical protein